MVLSAFLISELWTRVMLLLLFVICSCSESFQMVVAGIQRAFYIQNLLCFILNLDHVSCDSRVITVLDLTMFIIHIKIT